MAVDKAKVIPRLKALFPKANLSQKRIDEISDRLGKKLADDADETAIDAAINDFNDVLSIEDIAKGDDKVRTLEADKKKAEEAAKNAGKSGKKDDEEEEEDDDDTDGMTPFEKKMLKTIGGLKSDIDSIKSGNTKQTKLQEAQAMLEKSEVFKGLDDETKKFMLKNVELESDTPFDEQITGLETVFSKFVQGANDNGSFPGAAGGGKTEITVDQAKVDAAVDNMVG